MRKLKRFKLKGYMINKGPLEQYIKSNTHNLTFREAFDKTGIKINITVTNSIHQKFRLCNYITTPNLYLWSAAMASCSLPYIYGSSKLHYKGTNNSDYIESGKGFFDGSIGCDLPKREVAILYNISNVIVSLCNPYVLPFMATSSIIKNHKRYIFYRTKEKILELVGGEIKLRLRQLRDNGLIPRRLEMPINISINLERQ